MNRENVTFLILLTLLILLSMRQFGCTPPQGAAALDVAAYTAALAVCRAEGRDAGSMLVYGACAHEADIRYGVKP